jgi:RNA polymerase sigma factor (sigma-70 family)
MPSELSPSDEEAFIRLWRETHQMVYRVARVLTGGREQAEDVVSGTFEIVYVKWEKVVTSPAPVGWVLKTARNLCIDEWRKWASHWVDLPVEDFIASAHMDVPADPQLAAALRHLTPRQREVLAWRYLADLSRDEIAQLLEIDVDTVAEHLKRGLHKLRVLLDEPPERRVAE